MNHPNLQFYQSQTAGRRKKLHEWLQQILSFYIKFVHSAASKAQDGKMVISIVYRKNLLS
jgi:hypothetical protein